MKEIIKKIIGDNSVIKSWPIYYHVQRYRQYRPLAIDKSLTSRPDIVEALQKDGIFIIEDFVSKEVCEKIIQELNPIAEKTLANKFIDDVQTLEIKQKAFRIRNADQHSETANTLFFNNKLITEIAQAYVSSRAISYRREADYKTEAGHLLQADLPHFDDWRLRFKAFLYLTDVKEENAPFVYYKGSHEQVPWKKRYHLEFENEGESGRYGHFFLQEIKEIQRKYGYEEKVCTGKAGTLIFADFRGIHRGTSLKEGKRILLNNTFGITLKGIL